MIVGGLEVSVFGRNPIVSPFDILFALVMLLFIWRSIFGTFTFDFSDTTVLFLSSMFMLTELTSITFNLREIPRGVLAIKIFAIGYLSYVLFVSAIRRAEDVQRILFGLILWGSTIAVLLIYHYVNDWASIIGQDATSEVKGEIGIDIGQSNYLAALLVPILPIAVAGAFSGRRLHRIVGGVCAALILAGLLITMSKGAIIALLVGWLCAMPMLWRAGAKLRHALVLLGVLGCFILLALWVAPDLIVSYFERVLFRFDTPDFARLDLWKVAWEVFAAHPLLGIGPGSIYLYNRQFAIEVLYTHNFVLNTLAELGLAGGVSFFLLLWVLVRRSYRLCLSSLRDAKLNPIALGLFVGLLSTLAHGLVEPTFQGQQYVVIFWICMALIYLYQRILEQSALAPASNPILQGAQLTPDYGVRS
jgi:O-antigen ligase